jgi:hypothetical protein
VSFTIANNLLAPIIKATYLGISPRVIAIATYNNFKNLEYGSFGMKHPKRCSYTILDIPLENKWGTMVEA